MFNLNDLIEIDFFREIYKTHQKKIKNKNIDILIYQIIRDSINLMVKDLIRNTIINLKKNKIKSTNGVYLSKNQLVSFSSKFKIIEQKIRFFLRSKMYDNKKVLIKNNNGKIIIRKLFLKIKKNPNRFLNADQLKIDKFRAIADFISGMTDRYAINLYKNIK